MSDIKVGIIADDKTSKGIKSATKNIGTLDSSITKLAKSFAGVFAAQKILAFGKASAKAFAEDQAAAAKLTNVVKNLGLGFAAPEVEGFVQKLQAATGEIDDNLRPAMQTLLTTTGSIEKSQKLLAQSIDISRGAGVELTTVTQDLANAYVGNTKGLKKYNLGLTQAELKASSFADIQARLTKQFGGASKAYLDTYAGKMEVLNTAFSNAKENIGKGILDGLSLLASNGTDNINSAADAMDNFSTKIGNAVYGISVLIDKLGGDGKSPAWLNKLTSFITFGVGGQIFNKLAETGAKAQAAKTSTGFSFFGSPMEKLQKQREAEAKAKAEADAARRAKELLKAQQNNTKALKDQAALKKQSALFDLQQIQIVAALKGQLSDEDRKRAELQLALLQGDEDQAKKLTAQIADAIDKTGNLKKYLNDVTATNDPFKAWMESLEKIAAKVATITGTSYGDTSPSALGASVSTTDYFAGLTPAQQASYGGYSPYMNSGAAGTGSGNVTVNIDGKAVVNAILDQALSGNVAYINRTSGFFSS